MVWLEPINEPDRERCDWLGKFAVTYAKIALVEGIKLSMFAWSTGTPEPECWEVESAW